MLAGNIYLKEKTVLARVRITLLGNYMKQNEAKVSDDNQFNIKQLTFVTRSSYLYKSLHINSRFILTKIQH